MLGGPLQTRKTSVMVADLIRAGILQGRETQQHRGAQVRSYSPSELEEMYDLRTNARGALTAAYAQAAEEQTGPMGAARGVA